MGKTINRTLSWADKILMKKYIEMYNLCYIGSAGTIFICGLENGIYCDYSGDTITNLDMLVAIDSMTTDEILILEQFGETHNKRIYKSENQSLTV